MDILKLATDWAKAEVFSARFFILFALLFLIASIGFWQLGKTEMAKAYIVPSLICGLLLLAVGLGILFTNQSRISSFAEAYESDQISFRETEILRMEKSIGEFQNIVFKVIPGIIVLCSLIIVFVDKNSWRAAAISVIGMMVVILLVDSNAKARAEDYRAGLEQSAE